MSEPSRIDKEDVATIVEIIASLEYVSGKIMDDIPSFIGQFENRISQIDNLDKKLKILSSSVDEKIKSMSKEQKDIISIPEEAYMDLLNKISLVADFLEVSNKKAQKKKPSIMLKRLDDLSSQIKEISFINQKEEKDKKFYLPSPESKDNPSQEKKRKIPVEKTSLLGYISYSSFILGFASCFLSLFILGFIAIGFYFGK